MILSFIISNVFHCVLVICRYYNWLTLKCLSLWPNYHTRFFHSTSQIWFAFCSFFMFFTSSLFLWMLHWDCLIHDVPSFQLIKTHQIAIIEVMRSIIERWIWIISDIIFSRKLTVEKKNGVRSYAIYYELDWSTIR